MANTASLVLLLQTSFLGTVQAQEKDPLIAIATIRQLLNSTLIEYNNMNYTGASDLIDIAYIDNFEYVEDPLKEKDKELMKTTENMMHKELPGLIDDKSAYEDVRSMIANIGENLDEAEVLLK